MRRPGAASSCPVLENSQGNRVAIPADASGGVNRRSYLRIWLDDETAERRGRRSNWTKEDG
eukprot:3472630-Pyramimonas_sp.AAC.1